MQAFVKSATVSADVEGTEVSWGISHYLLVYSLSAVSSPLVVCKAPLLEVILSALTQTDPGGKKLACSIFSDLLNAQGVLDHSEVSCSAHYEVITYCILDHSIQSEV